MSVRHLIFSRQQWQVIEEYLFPAEKFLLALARPYLREQRLVYRVEHLSIPSTEDYASVGQGGLTLSEAASARFNRYSAMAEQYGLVPVHLHSHPHGIPNFSCYDDIHEKQLHEWLRGQGQPLLLSLVWAEGNTPRARLWAEGSTHDGSVWVGLQPVNMEAPERYDLPALARQQAFGLGLRQAAAQLRIGIVGLGGIGLPVAEQLARAGFVDFVLIDHDQVEQTNLNRLPGARLGDIGKSKLSLAYRVISQACKSIGTKARIKRFSNDIYTAPSRIKKMLGSCDVILSLTDNHLSRIECLRLAFDGGACFFQAGVEILLQESPPQLLFEIMGAEHGRFCPICTGRLDPGQASLEARRYVGGEVWQRALSDGYVPDVPAPAVMSINAMAAGALVLELQRRIAKLGADWDLFQMEFNSGTIRSFKNIESQLNTGCSVCGRSGEADLD